MVILSRPQCVKPWALSPDLHPPSQHIYIGHPVYATLTTKCSWRVSISSQTGGSCTLRWCWWPGTLPSEISSHNIDQHLSHYLNLYWLTINWTLSCFNTKLQWNFNQNVKILFRKNAFETVVCKICVILFQHQQPWHCLAWINRISSKHKSSQSIT